MLGFAMVVPQNNNDMAVSLPRAGRQYLLCYLEWKIVVHHKRSLYVSDGVAIGTSLCCGGWRCEKGPCSRSKAVECAWLNEDH